MATLDPMNGVTEAVARATDSLMCDNKPVFDEQFCTLRAGDLRALLDAIAAYQAALAGDGDAERLREALERISGCRRCSCGEIAHDALYPKAPATPGETNAG